MAKIIPMQAGTKGYPAYAASSRKVTDDEMPITYSSAFNSRVCRVQAKTPPDTCSREYFQVVLFPVSWFQT